VVTALFAVGERLLAALLEFAQELRVTGKRRAAPASVARMHILFEN